MQSIAQYSRLPVILLSAVCGMCGLLRSAEIPYADAYAAAKNGIPLIVVVSADWCKPCKRLKADLDKDGIPYTVCDVDKPAFPELRKTHYFGGAIPQVVIWWRTGATWHRTTPKATAAAVKEDIKETYSELMMAF